MNAGLATEEGLRLQIFSLIRQSLFVYMYNWLHYLHEIRSSRLLVTPAQLMRPGSYWLKCILYTVGVMVTLHNILACLFFLGDIIIYMLRMHTKMPTDNTLKQKRMEPSSKNVLCILHSASISDDSTAQLYSSESLKYQSASSLSKGVTV